MQVRVMRHADYRRMRWKNGGGWTTELIAMPTATPDAGANFDWRVSIAEIEADSAFSTFLGYDRHIALLEGVGMELCFDNAESVRLDQRLRFVPFAGEVHVFGKLISGSVRDFNVIVRRAAWRAEILHRPLVGPMLFTPDAAIRFVYLVSGHAACRVGVTQHTLSSGDSLLLQTDAATDNAVLGGAGEVVLVRFIPAIS